MISQKILGCQRVLDKKIMLFCFEKALFYIFYICFNSFFSSLRYLLIPLALLPPP